MKKILYEASPGFLSNDQLIEEFKENLAELHQRKRNIILDKENFINTYGDEKDLEDTINDELLSKFSKQTHQKAITEAALKIENTSLKNIEAELKELNKNTSPITENDEKSIRFNNVKDFIFDLDELMEGTKENIYNDFAKSLQQQLLDLKN